MMRKRIMASLLALTMVLGMSLNSFAGLRNPDSPAGDYNPIGTIKTRSTRHVSLADFLRLRNVCNEVYDDKNLVKKVVDNGKLVGTAEPVGSDVTEPEEKDELGNAKQKALQDRKYTGRTVDQSKIIYGPVNEATGKATVERVETTQLKLTSMHDAVVAGNKIRFVNGMRLSDTEFVIRVDSDAKASQSFSGDYFVSVIPYAERVVGHKYDNDKKREVDVTEPYNVPDEFGPMYNNKMYGPAWFFCMLFDETQAKNPDIIGYLVARRITRWPHWTDTRFYYGNAPLKVYETKDGVVVEKDDLNPTQKAREAATVYKTVNNQRVVDYSTFYDVSQHFAYATYAYPSQSVVESDSEGKTTADWLDRMIADNNRY